MSNVIFCTGESLVLSNRQICREEPLNVNFWNAGGPGPGESDRDNVLSTEYRAVCTRRGIGIFSLPDFRTLNGINDVDAIISPCNNNLFPISTPSHVPHLVQLITTYVGVPSIPTEYVSFLPHTTSN